MFQAVIAMIVLIGLAVGGTYLHKNNMDNTYKKVDKYIPKSSNNDQSRGMDIKKDLMMIMFTHQGPNFNALVISAWLLFFVAGFFSFLLTPQLSEGLTYLKIPDLPSLSIGLLLFALIPLFIGTVLIVALKLPRVYGYYIIPRQLKKAIMVTWLLPAAAMIIPVYLATIFPYRDSNSFLIDIAFILLVLSLFMLLSPIYFEAKEAKL